MMPGRRGVAGKEGRDRIELSMGTAVRFLALCAAALAPAIGGAVDAAGHFARARYAWQSGQYEAALAEYEAAIELQGEDSAARNNRALIYMETGRLPEARLEAERAVELAPQEGRFRITLAVVLLTVAPPEYEDARSHLLKAVRYLKRKRDAPGLLRAYYNLGYICQRRAEYRQARGWYKLALGINPNDEPTLTALEAMEGRGESRR